ncbi:EcoRII N-terminal effector-binding domain-containing protein [Klebsiella pneumoniae]|uniref:EcoRII N-terminal effector-binding domain-containing protein n=1 Tax=Klebsiella pneumoniae TaxID=573 RepID=UPI00296F4267|nr:EcoRII N-terminal effector-binding domain-containing protein [Klebsiella pneumoniae]
MPCSGLAIYYNSRHFGKTANERITRWGRGALLVPDSTGAWRWRLSSLMSEGTVRRCKYLGMLQLS